MFCPACKTTVEIGQRLTWVTTPNDQLICEPCFDKLYIYCTHCDRLKPKPATIHTTLCQNCCPSFQETKPWYVTMTETWSLSTDKIIRRIIVCDNEEKAKKIAEYAKKLKHFTCIRIKTTKPYYNPRSHVATFHSKLWDWKTNSKGCV